MLNKQTVLLRWIARIILLLFCLLLIKGYFFHQTSIAPAIVSVVNGIYYNLKSPWLNLNLWINDLVHFNSLRKNLKMLEEENLRLSNQLLELYRLRKENEVLTAALRLKKEKLWRLLPAEIIFLDPTGLNGSFWINKGSSDGLKKGMNVITKDKVLLGYLTQCYPNYCQGYSIYRPNLKIGVKDIRSETLAVAKRDFKGVFYLDLLPPKADIRRGDILITSSENSLLLNDLLVAKVSQVISHKSSLEKKYILEPLLNKNKLTSVLVILNFVPHNE